MSTTRLPSVAAAPPPPNLPAVHEYLDFRAFLRDWFEIKKLQSPTFSYRVFARKAGFASHAFLSEVIQGRRNLSEDSVDKCLLVLQLVGDAAEFFRMLVRYGQETQLDRREDLQADLLRLQASRAVQRVGGRQAGFYASWVHAVVREMAVNSPWGKDAQTMAKYLLPQVQPDEVDESLRLLVETGLLRREGPDAFAYSAPRLTPGDVPAEVVQNLKRQMVLLAVEQLAQPDPESHMGAVTVSVSRKRLARVREILDRARREILAETATDVEPIDRVVQVTFQMVPLTRSFSGSSRRGAP